MPSPLQHTVARARRRAIPTLLSLLGAWIVGCADVHLPTTDAGGLSTNRVASPPTDERVALQEVTRAVALALATPGVRAKVLTDMQSSTVREHKLELTAYLSGPLWQQLLNAATVATGRTASSFLQLLSQIRPLEFYMPVEAHRRTWQGGAEVLVAAQLAAKDTPLGFSTTGEPVVLSLNRAPDAPTLALVPVETDFSAQRTTSTGGALLRAPRGAASFVIQPPPDCDPYTQNCSCTADCSPPPPSNPIPTTAPTGLYMTYSDLYDAAEPWIKGTPEVEVHILGPAITDQPTYARQVSCSGEHQTGWRYFDQNANNWPGAVMLLSEQEILARGYKTPSTEPRGFSIVLYEDDDESCVIHDDKNRLAGDFTRASSVSALVGAILVGCGGWACAFFDIGIGGLAVSPFLADLFETNDDYLGIAVPRANVPAYTGSITTHALLKHDNVINGGIKLVYHVYGQ